MTSFVSRFKSLALATALTLLGTNFAQAQVLVPRAEVPNAQKPQLVQPVQSTDNYRVIELEETVRRLNGKVEELNFLLIQLQEKMRKMEEDNEIRFQELEDQQSSLSEPKNSDVAKVEDTNRLGKPQSSEAATPSDDNSITEPTNSGSFPKVAKVEPAVRIGSKTQEPQVQQPRAQEPQAQESKSLEPRALGTLTFDKQGNVIDGASGIQPAATSPFGSATTGSIEASEFGATPNEVFVAAKQAYDSRNYLRAQQGFKAHMLAWPEDPQSGQSRYFLGQSLFWQKQYFNAAEVFLETHNKFPKEVTAAENLLGLGLSLAGLNQREVACATYAEVLKQYPAAKARLAERIKDEQAAARCL